MIDYISQIILIDVSAFKWNCWNCFVSDVMILWLHSWHSTAKERTYLIEFKAIEFFWTIYLYYLYDLSTGLACIDCFVSTFPLLSVMSHWNVRACIICVLQCVVCFKGLVFDFKAVAFFVQILTSRLTAVISIFHMAWYYRVTGWLTWQLSVCSPWK